MFLSMRHKPHIPQARKTEVIDKNTGAEIPRVIWANDETGRYRQYLSDENGEILIDTEKKEIRSKIFTGNIELRRTDE